MIRTALIHTPALLLAMGLAACSSASDAPDGNISMDGGTSRSANLVAPVADDAGSPVVRENSTASTQPAAPTRTIGLEGLGGLRIGEPVPRGSAWKERGAQTGDACRTVSSPNYPGVYAIVSDDVVRRITIGQNSDVKLVEGIGPGATESDVEKWFAGFRAEPHKYEPFPAKYLTTPNAASGGPALRFEVNSDGKVALIHVGTMPVLAYVEGCA